MSVIKFDKTNKGRLRKASRKEIENYFVSMPPGERRRKWLRKKNQYRLHTTAQLAIDHASSAVNDKELVQYIAASGPCHVIDSWGLLARAIEAALRGDAYAATHFGYYAELRAAFALLACEGLGIMRNRHPIVLAGGVIDCDLKGQQWNPTTKKYDKAKLVQTHALVWPALRHWTTLSRAGDLLDELVCPAGTPLSDWLDVCGIVVPVREIARRWLRVWGLDLSVLDDDHNARNLASYRPSEFRRPPDLEVAEVLEFTENLWRLFEPGNQHRFPNLERFLLRRTLRMTGASVPTVAVLEGIGISSLSANEWVTFLAKTDDPKPFELAERARDVDDPHCHLSIISRAALLLFLSTSAARRLLVNAAYERETVAFWWKRHGSARVLWDIDHEPVDPLDLWADIEASLKEAQLWRSGSGPGGGTLRAWRRAQPGVLDDFGSLELAGIWGLLP